MGGQCHSSICCATMLAPVFESFYLEHMGQVYLNSLDNMCSVEDTAFSLSLSLSSLALLAMYVLTVKYGEVDAFILDQTQGV